jgi:hypothetical protein
MLSPSMLGDYSTSASLTPSCFLCRTDQLGNPFLITSLLDLLLFSSLLFSDHHTGHPARHDARILLMSASLMSSEFFFIIVSIYWKPASNRSSLDLSSLGKEFKQVAC